MTRRYSLEYIIIKLEYPARANDVIKECRSQSLPDALCDSFAARLKGRNFNSPADLEDWFSANITDEEIKQLGVRSIGELFQRTRKAA